MILNARPLTVKIGNKTVKRVPIWSYYPYFMLGRGFIGPMTIETCADEGAVETLFTRLTERGLLPHHFSSPPPARVTRIVEIFNPCRDAEIVSCLEEENNYDDTPRRQRPKGRPRACAAVRCVIAVLAARASIRRRRVGERYFSKRLNVTFPLKVVLLPFGDCRRNVWFKFFVW